MKTNNIILYLVGFILIAVILKLIGLVNFNNFELLAVIFAALGSGMVYNSMGENKKISLFFGTAVFLTGVVFLLIGSQQVPNSSRIVFASVLYIIGISCFMLFLDNTSDKTLVLVSFIFILLGVIYTAISGSFSFNTFVETLSDLIGEFWLILLVVIIVIYILAKGSNKKE